LKRAHILVEGHTEESFVNRLLGPHLTGYGLHLTPVLIATGRTKAGRHFKGGVTSYGKLRRDLRRLLLDSSVAAVTTMIDFYGLPRDFPGRSSLPKTSCWDRAEHLERALLNDLDEDPRFIPYLSLHEFEALLFVAPSELGGVVRGGNALLRELERVTVGFSSPEEINDGRETHPSARVTDLAPTYRKALHGPLAAGRIGLEKMRQSCPHFDGWVSRLEALG